MKAVFLVGPRLLELRDVPDPLVPRDGLLVQVKACGVCGSDLRRWKEGPSGSPYIPGHEIAGIVSAVGADVGGYAVGDRVAVAPDVHCGHCYYCQRAMYNLCDDLRFLGTAVDYPGGFAEQIVLTGEVLSNGCIHHLPDGMSFIAAALAEPCSSVLAAHDKVGTSLNDTVLVMGGGPIGCLHVIIAKARGARVILSEPNAGRRQLARRFAPDAIVDPHSEDVALWVRRFTHGLGVDIAICANPVAATQAQAVELVRKGGQIVLFGGLPKAAPMTTLDANRIHYGEIMVVGSFSYHPVYHARALDLLRRNIIPTDLVTHTFPLEQTEQAFAMADGGDALKVMVAT